MRFPSVLAAAAMLIAATPAFASTIVQDLRAQQNGGDFTPFDIDGAPFDPALGTLTAVTATLTGVLGPVALYEPNPGTMQPSPGILSTNYFVVAGPPGSANFLTGTLPPQTVTPSSGTGTADYIGAATSVDLAFNFPLLSAFISPAPGPETLADFGFHSNVAGARGPLTDNTGFNGTFALTYTYNAAAVPEPASLLILGFGAGLVPLLKRRRVA